jgi:formylglycine-generating enzyme required for sulfatase activity
MGSPIDEVGRYEDELRHQVRIDRTFAIATGEVTLGQFARFLEDSAAVKPKDWWVSVNKLSPTSECPVVRVDWYDAARYCNWLSLREGIPQSQWCYPLEIKEGMQLPADCLERTGYRLPTEAEWEYACRAGSTLSRHEGVSDALLSKYAWYKDDTSNPHRQHHPTGQLKPNKLGLFDMLGNVWEWTHDPSIEPYTSEPERTRSDNVPSGAVSYDTERALRGGATDCAEPHYVRSAMRNRHLPHSRYGSDGFRVARTLKQPPRRSAPPARDLGFVE